MKTRIARMVGLMVAVPLAVLTAAASASDRNDHERARRALETGQILPLRAVLERVERDHPGELIEVELERDDGVWQYEIKLIRSDGAIVKLKLDARDGSPLQRESRQERGDDRKGRD